MKYIIEIKDETLFIKRLRGSAELDIFNKLDESYAPVSLQVGAVYLAAIINGFQPPRCLVHLDKPID